MLKGHTSLYVVETTPVVNLAIKRVCVKGLKEDSLSRFCFCYHLFVLLSNGVEFIADRKERDSKKHSSKKRKVLLFSNHFMIQISCFAFELDGFGLSEVSDSGKKFAVALCMVGIMFSL